MPKNNCRVCGFELVMPPWGPDDQTPTWEICDCCGTEFGYEDCTIASTKKRRFEWLASGAKWFDEKLKPTDWSVDAQFDGIPIKYR